MKITRDFYIFNRLFLAPFFFFSSFQKYYDNYILASQLLLKDQEHGMETQLVKVKGKELESNLFPLNSLLEICI